MANGYTNTVPQGQAGTGGAFILGPNRALQYALQQRQEREGRIAAGEQQFYQRQAAYNNQFQKTLMEMGQFAETPMFQEDFAHLTNELVRQGGEMMARGINPFNPHQSESDRSAVQQWNTEYNQLRSAKAMVDIMHKDIQYQIKRYENNPDDYDIDDFNEIRDFQNNYSLEDILSGQASVPRMSRALRIGEEIAKQYGPITRAVEEMYVNEQGQEMRRSGTEADLDRIAYIANSQINPNTQYGREVNRRLRKEFGDGASMDGLLMTTDRDEVRDILDRQFRNQGERSPIVELMASGIDARPGTPEYESFLEQATNEQLRAEQIYADAVNEAGMALQMRVNPTVTERVDFTYANQRRADAAAARSARNSNAAYQNMLLRNQKLRDGGSEVQDLISTAIDLDFSEYFEGEEITPGIQVPGAIPVASTSFPISATDAIDVETGRKTKNTGQRVTLSSIAPTAFDKDGNVVSGESLEELMRNSNVVEFRPMAVVQSGSGSRTREHMYDPSVIPVKQFSSNYREGVNQTLKIQEEATRQLNEALKNRPSNKDDSWRSYEARTDEMFSPVAPIERGFSSSLGQTGKSKIVW